MAMVLVCFKKTSQLPSPAALSLQVSGTTQNSKRKCLRLSLISKFKQYSCGRTLAVVTDYKTLVAISKKPLSKSSKRLQSPLLRTQVYHFELVHRHGKEFHLSDTLSRVPLIDIVAVDKLVNNLSHIPLSPQSGCPRYVQPHKPMKHRFAVRTQSRTAGRNANVPSRQL